MTPTGAVLFVDNSRVAINDLAVRGGATLLDLLILIGDLPVLAACASKAEEQNKEDDAKDLGKQLQDGVLHNSSRDLARLREVWLADKHMFVFFVVVNSNHFSTLVVSAAHELLGREVNNTLLASLACRMYFGKAFLITEALNDVDLVEAAG